MNNKSKSTTFLLCFFLGVLGVHRFYLNKVLSGILMLVTGGGLTLWWLIDIYLVATDRMQDKEGQDLYTGPPDPDNPRAGFWVRLAAVLVDGILLELLLLIIIALPVTVAMYLGVIGMSETDQELLAVANTFLIILISLLYFALPLARRHQATPGKRCFDLQVTTRDEEAVGLLRALWRTLCYVISAIPLWIGFFIAGLKSKRALHDLLAGTQVVYAAESGYGRLSVTEPQAMTNVATSGGAVTSADGDSTSTRGPVLMMLLGIVLLLAASAAAVL